VNNHIDNILSDPNMRLYLNGIELDFCVLFNLN